MADLPISLKELSKLRLGRETLERWIQEPELEEIIKGCFVRVIVCEKKGTRVYRICVVKGLETSETSYPFGDTTTNRFLKLEFGNVVKPFKMDYVSNAEFTESEFDDWVKQMRKCNMPILTGKDVDKKVKKIKVFVTEKRMRELREAEAKKQAEDAGKAQETAVSSTAASAESNAQEKERKRDRLETADAQAVQPAIKKARREIVMDFAQVPPPPVLAADDLPLLSKHFGGAAQIGDEKLTFEECYKYYCALFEQNTSQANAIRQLQKELDDKDDDRERKNRSIVRLESGDDSEFRRMDDDNEMTETEKRLAELHSRFEVQRSEIRDEIRRKDDHMNELKTKLKDLRKEHETIYKTIDKERRDSKALAQKKEREMYTLQFRLKETIGKIQVAQAKVSEHQQVIDIQDELIDELQQQLKEEEQQQIILQKKRRQQAQLLGAKTKQNKEAQQEIEELNGKFEALQSDPALLQAARIAVLQEAV